MSRILLIGDNCIDVFLMVDCNRISPERPVPVLTLDSMIRTPGMGGNVLANLLSLAPGVTVTALFPDQPSVKTRYVDRLSNQHFVRIDQDAPATPLSQQEFLETLNYPNNGDGSLTKWDACVISDYAKGYITVSNLKGILLECEKRGIPTFVDTKMPLGEWSQSATVIKINAKEYAAQFAAGVREPWLQCKNLIVTQGARGMMLLDEEGGEEYRTTPSEVAIKDVVGAGDTTLAALVTGYLEFGDLTKAMDFAGRAAEVAVSKPGVVAVKREEVV